MCDWANVLKSVSGNTAKLDSSLTRSKFRVPAQIQRQAASIAHTLIG